MKKSFLEFCNELEGFTFHSKKTGNQIYRFELYWSRFTPAQCFEKFESRIIINDL